MWSARQFWLAVAFAALGGGAWWLMQSRPREEDPRIVRPRAPDAVVSHFVAVEHDNAGHPSRRLVAEQLRQFLKEDVAELDEPRLAAYESEGPPWEAQATHGLILRGGEELRLSDSVQVSRGAQGESRPMLLQTSELTVWPKRDYAEGNNPVRIDSDGDWLTANGIRLWYAKPTRGAFPGRARIFLAPATIGHSDPKPDP